MEAISLITLYNIQYILLYLNHGEYTNTNFDNRYLFSLPEIRENQLLTDIDLAEITLSFIIFGVSRRSRWAEIKRFIFRILHVGPT